MDSISQAKDYGEVMRQNKDGTKSNIPCHQSFVNYNMYMGGVDRGDQLRGYYKCAIKTRKWYKYLFYFLFDVAITNSYILYKHYSQNTYLKNIKSFQLQLANERIGDYCTQKHPGRVSSSVTTLPVRHFPLKCKDRKRRKCVLCTKANKRRDTNWQCNECDVWLCHTGEPSTDCFLKWHKKISDL